MPSLRIHERFKLARGTTALEAELGFRRRNSRLATTHFTCEAHFAADEGLAIRVRS